MSSTYTSRPALQARGRGSDRQNSRGRKPTDTQRKPGESPAANKNKATPVSQQGRGRARGRSMDYPGQRLGRDPNRFGDDGSGEGSSNNPDAEPSGPVRASGYTMFQPNEKKRQEVSQMAQRETAAYEQYKKANASKSFSYVGTTGGGEITHEQARLRQANSVRAQSFNRRMKQEDHRQARKRVEDEEIEKKKAEARRKAEQNALREQQLQASPDDVRRKREAFLNQLERKTTNAASFEQQHQRNSTPPKRPQPHHNSSAPATFPVGSVFHTKTDGRVNKTSKGREGRAESSRYVTEDHSRTESHAQGAPRNARDRPMPDLHQDEEFESDELTILTSMFPDLDPDYLGDLLFQMGSADGVIEVLDV